MGLLHKLVYSPEQHPLIWRNYISRRVGTYLMGRCSSSNFLGDWYEQYWCRVRLRTVWVPQFKKVQGVPSFLWESSAKVTNDSNREGGVWSHTGWGTVLLVSVSEEVRRTTSPRQVSTYPPGKYNFFFTPSLTDTHNTGADYKGYWHELPETWTWTSFNNSIIVLKANKTHDMEKPKGPAQNRQASYWTWSYVPIKDKHNNKLYTSSWDS